MRPVATNERGQELAIVGRARCGCVTAMALDIPGDARLLEELRRWKASGLRLERATVDGLHDVGLGCAHPPEREAPRLVGRGM